jgi:hypothetical protein
MSKPLALQPARTAHKSISHTEPWVDLRALAEHIGFEYQATRRMVEADKIPGKAFDNGKKTFWRFQLSACRCGICRRGERALGMAGEGFFHIDRRIWKLLCERAG